MRRFSCLAVVLSAVACGGASSHGSFDGSVYRDGPIAFHLDPAPAEWKRIDVTEAALAFRDERNEASILVNARCKKTDDGTPLVALKNHLVIGATEREIVSEKVVPFDRREALHTTMRVKWDGVPMELDIFVLKKDGCVYDFVYLAPPPTFDAGAPAFESFVKSFRTLPGSGVVG